MEVDAKGYQAGVALGFVTVLVGTVALWYLGVRKAVITRASLEASKAIEGELRTLGIQGLLAREAGAEVSTVAAKALDQALP